MIDCSLLRKIKEHIFHVFKQNCKQTWTLLHGERVDNVFIVYGIVFLIRRLAPALVMRNFLGKNPELQI